MQVLTSQVCAGLHLCPLLRVWAGSSPVCGNPQDIRCQQRVQVVVACASSSRCEAVVTIAYEAQARIRDPVYRCVAHIFTVQQPVYLNLQRILEKWLAPWWVHLMLSCWILIGCNVTSTIDASEGSVSSGMAGSRSFVDQRQWNVETYSQPYSNLQCVSPHNSLDSSFDGLLVQEMYCKEEIPAQACHKEESTTQWAGRTPSFGSKDDGELIFSYVL